MCVNNGEPLWETAGLKHGDTATVTLHEKQKYATVQKALDATYTNNRSDYASDEVFVNFRPMKGGNLAEGVMYRSASPIDNHCSSLISTMFICVLSAGLLVIRFRRYA